MHKLSWIPDHPDHRDFLYSAVHAAPKAVPNVVDLSTSVCMPPVFDQGQLGSCVDNAWGGLLTFVEAKEGNGQELLSRLFMYWNARTDRTQDTGSTLRDCIKGVAAKGVCLESLWPYDIAKFTVCPPTPAWGEAWHRMNGLVYSSIVTLQDMLNCLASGYPFVFGASLFGIGQSVDLDNLTAASPVLHLPTYNESLQGGHALMVVGYNLATKLFKVRNSWGADFCQNGYFYMPFSYITNPGLCDDFWTARKIAK
jgi:C1A family cysteine protease